MTKIVEILKGTSDKVIFICSSSYNILIAFSLIMRADLYGKCALILPTDSQKNKEYFRKITLDMERQGIICEIITKNKIRRTVGISDIENILAIKRVLKKLHTQRYEFFLVNHMWNKVLVYYPASIWFRYCKESIFIEEGSGQKAMPDENPFMIWLKNFYGNQKREFWKDNRVKGIYVQNRELFSSYPIPELKQFELNIDFSKEEKQKLLDLFANRQDRIEIERLEEEADGIIYTQPLSEDGYVKKEEKIRIYKELVTYYSKYGKVFVKIHPRDTTQYDFPEEMILQGGYPSELLNILGIQFKFAIGLCTSAV
ncbi:MAG: glycosyltransferase family 52 protein, partial [Bacillus sp. (in: Bacteria)]|nr:glycosyltransferase family 52 protein [Bacillus sp. (in: firmicutes)]